MNDNSPKRNLLADVVRDADDSGFRDELKSQAIHEFRQASRRRKTVSKIRAIAALTLLVVGSSFLLPQFLSRPSGSSWLSLVSLRMEEPTQPDAPVATIAPSPIAEANTITDEELLSRFPPRSCFLAEVDGQMILVFYDPEVERIYMR